MYGTNDSFIYSLTYTANIPKNSCKEHRADKAYDKFQPWLLKKIGRFVIIGCLKVHII